MKLLPFLATAGIVIATLGCAVGSPHRVVYVDAAFLPEERAGIEAAMDGWMRATPVADFGDRRTLSHPDIVGAVLDPEPGAVYLVRVTADRPGDCPSERGFAKPTRSRAETFVKHLDETDKRLTCFNSTLIGPNRWRRTAAHELGHVLGIEEHSSAPESVMRLCNDECDDISIPSCEDVRQAEEATGRMPVRE